MKIIEFAYFVGETNNDHLDLGEVVGETNNDHFLGI